MSHHPRAKRLDFVLKMAQDQEEKRLKAFGEAQRKLHEEVEQRQLLTRYQEEYQRQISAPSTQAVSAGVLHGTLNFMQQIEQALVAQKEKIALLNEQVEAAKKSYLEQHGKVQALVKLMEKLDQEFFVEEDKKQQKQADEWANRAASMRMRRS